MSFWRLIRFNPDFSLTFLTSKVGIERESEGATVLEILFHLNRNASVIHIGRWMMTWIGWLRVSLRVAIAGCMRGIWRVNRDSRRREGALGVSSVEWRVSASASVVVEREKKGEVYSHIVTCITKSRMEIELKMKAVKALNFPETPCRVTVGNFTREWKKGAFATSLVVWSGCKCRNK